MRERWFGATGRRVPEVVVEGDPSHALDEALILDNVEDVPRLQRAHAEGVPVVVRASTPDQVKVALARPEVACVLVPAERAHLRDLDLTELTYG
jgi:hypothetical protein